jgi:hypothetical protein
MNINRHNYETFFLLYTDNELSVAERKAVDEFVIANPDLLEELDMLQQSILLPDNIEFDFKDSLLKRELITDDIQEKLLLHLDNELAPTEKTEIEFLINKEAGIESEWKILQSTKLTADVAIVFEDKQSLYKKEEGRVVAFPWRKMAAAAVLIGFGIWGGMTYLKNDTKIKGNDLATVETSQPTENRVNTKPQEIIPADTMASVKGTDIASTKENAAPNLAPAKNDVAVKRSTDSAKDNTTETAVATPQKDNNLPKPYFNNLNKTESNKTIIASVTPLKQTNNIVDPGNNAITKNYEKQETANPYASTTSLTLIANSEETDSHILYMDEEKVKKTKIGGFFRKVKRVIERTTNIKTGANNFKVANLEFAIQ